MGFFKVPAIPKVPSINVDPNKALNAAVGLVAVGNDKYATALKAALEQGVVLSVDILAASGGFSKSKYHIPWPTEYEMVVSAVSKVPGMDAKLREFEEKMNEAAEKAVRECLQILIDAVTHMTVMDALSLFQDKSLRSMTHFMRRVTWDPLGDRCRPPIHQILEATHVPQLLHVIIETYNKIPFISKAPDFDLTGYVLAKCLGALFDQLGGKEETFRQDPWGHLTGATQKVFGEFAGERPSDAPSVLAPPDQRAEQAPAEALSALSLDKEVETAEAQAPPRAAADDPAAKLAKFKGMLDQGLIDQDDYEKKKDEILATI